MSIKTIKFLKKITGGPLTFSKMLQGLRRSDEVSQVDLANAVGVSKGLICDIEKGRRLPTLEHAKGMAKFLGYSMNGFISILLQDQLRNANINMKVTLKKAS